MTGCPPRIAIIGDRRIPARYSGFSTLVERLPPALSTIIEFDEKKQYSGGNATKPKPRDDSNNGKRKADEPSAKPTDDGAEGTSASATDQGATREPASELISSNEDLSKDGWVTTRLNR